MNYDVYNVLYVKEGYSIFEFLSIGPKGIIPKRVAFIPTEYESVYNLTFGDVNVYGEINDYSISDNGDRNKVLATLVHVMEIYLRRFPERWVYFTGSTGERTRLYRMVVSINFDELKDKFDIFAIIEGEVLPFRKNMHLDGILVRIKH